MLVSVPSGGVVIFLPVTSWSVIWAPTRAAHGMAGNTRLKDIIQKRTSFRVFSGIRVIVWRPFCRLLVFVSAGFGRLDDQRTYWKAHASLSQCIRDSRFSQSLVRRAMLTETRYLSET